MIQITITIEDQSTPEDAAKNESHMHLTAKAQVTKTPTGSEMDVADKICRAIHAVNQQIESDPGFISGSTTTAGRANQIFKEKEGGSGG